jgi:hypothetical protein
LPAFRGILNALAAAGDARKEPNQLTGNYFTTGKSQQQCNTCIIKFSGGGFSSTQTRLLRLPRDLGIKLNLALICGSARLGLRPKAAKPAINYDDLQPAIQTVSGSFLVVFNQLKMRVNSQRTETKRSTLILLLIFIIAYFYWQWPVAYI